MSDLQDHSLGQESSALFISKQGMLDTCSNFSFSNDDNLLQTRLKGKHLYVYVASG